MKHIEHVLFDLDGTLITSYMDSRERDFNAWHVLPGRTEMVARLRQRGVTMSIITNQAGVAFGYARVAEVATKLILVAQALGFADMDIYDGGAEPRHHGGSRNGGGTLTAHVAYEHPQASIERWREDPLALATNRRKPSPVMVHESMRIHYANSIRCIYVGDRPEDQAAANNAGVQFAWAEEFFQHGR